MAITFEEVSTEISPAPRPAEAAAPAPAAPPAELARQIDDALRLKTEREARVCDA